VSQWDSDLIDEQYTDGIKILERLVFDLDVPTIAVINARSGVRVLSRRHGTAGIGPRSLGD